MEAVGAMQKRLTKKGAINPHVAKRKSEFSNNTRERQKQFHRFVKMGRECQLPK